MNKFERGEALEQQVDEFVADLEYQLTLGFTDNFLKVLEWYSNFRNYSLLNTYLIHMQCPEARLCAGMKAWNKLGHRVAKGQQAIWVRAPWMKKETDPDTGEVKERLIGWLAVQIFDVSQLEGDVELPTWREQLSGNYDTYYALAVTAIGGQTDFLVYEDSLPRGVHGMSMQGRIYVAKDLDPSVKFLTLLHELAHQTLEHHHRHQETTLGQRELVAESVSFVLARIYGLDNPYSRDYIKLYRGTTEGLREVLSEIHLAVKRIVAMLGIEPVQQLPQAQEAA